MSKQHAIYYLVDTENPGGFNTVEDLLKKTAEEKCRLYLFYSENTSKLAPATVEKMLDAGCVKLIRVKTGHNSLDFCLISMAQDAGIRMSRTGSPERPVAKKAAPAKRSSAGSSAASSASQEKRQILSGRAVLELSELSTGSAEAEEGVVLSQEDVFSLPEKLPEIPALPAEAGLSAPVILDGRIPGLSRGSRPITRLDPAASPVPEELLQAVQELLLDAGIRDIGTMDGIFALASENTQGYLTKACGCTGAQAAAFFQKTDRAQRKLLCRLAQRSLQGGN